MPRMLDCSDKAWQTYYSSFITDENILTAVSEISSWPVACLSQKPLQQIVLANVAHQLHCPRPCTGFSG